MFCSKVDRQSAAPRTRAITARRTYTRATTRTAHVKCMPCGAGCHLAAMTAVYGCSCIMFMSATFCCNRNSYLTSELACMSWCAVQCAVQDCGSRAWPPLHVCTRRDTAERKRAQQQDAHPFRCKCKLGKPLTHAPAARAALTPSCAVRLRAPRHLQTCIPAVPLQAAAGARSHSRFSPPLPAPPQSAPPPHVPWQLRHAAR